MPKFKSKTHSKKKKIPKKPKKEYTPFPPPMPESKIDKELASGEYFLKAGEKKAKKIQEIRDKQKSSAARQKEKRSQAFIAPPESAPAAKVQKTDSNVDIEALKKKIKKAQKKKKP